MNLERNNQGNAKKEKLVIYIGRSTEFVSLETVLHVYQLIANRNDIELNLDGIDWD
jgi:hypothetical protein